MNYLILLVTVVPGGDGKEHLLQICPSFNPGMTHQVFEDEKIVGVKNPQVDIYFNPATCDVCHFSSLECRCVSLQSVTARLKVSASLSSPLRSTKDHSLCSQVDVSGNKHQSLHLSKPYPSSIFLIPSSFV